MTIASYTLREIAARLGGEVSGNQVLAPAPGHSPKDRGLAFKKDSSAPDGYLVHLFNGGDPIAARDYVREKLSLPPFTPKRRGKSKTTNGDASHGKPITPSKEEIERATAAATAAMEKPATAPARKIVATYDYRDADGTLLYQVLRYEPKTFSQRAADGSFSLVGVKRVLYRLPELIEDSAAVVFITEGEKDADRVASLGLCATTISGGTKWTPEIVEPLRNRDVVIVPDYDSKGAARALEAANALHGVAASIKMIFLPGLDGAPGNNDVSDWLGHSSRTDIFAETCLAARLWVPGAEVEGMAAAMVVNAKEAPAADAPAGDVAASLGPLPFIDISAWHVDRAPLRDWAVRDLIPMRNVFLLSGEGAAGKTLLMLQLGIAHALGKDWIGTLPEPGPFLFLGAEDDADEIYRRVADILKHYGADFSELKDRVHLLSYAGEDAVLACTNSKAGIVTPTALFERFFKAAVEIKPVMIGIDTSADVFAGNENDRAQVRQFVGLLRRVAIKANAAVIVNTHPSLSGISTGTGLSGSTGWHNSVRARAYLTTIKTGADEEPDPNLRMLEFKKNNYGPVGKSIALRWENGIYKPVGGLDTFDKLAAEHQADTVFLTLLARFNAQDRNVSPNPGQTFAPTIFSREPEAKTKGLKVGALKDAMSRLFDSNQIHVELIGPPSHRRARLEVGPRP